MSRILHSHTLTICRHVTVCLLARSRTEEECFVATRADILPNHVRLRPNAITTIISFVPN